MDAIGERFELVAGLIDSALEHRFFFQAEDGIRDDLVTGVQTCALPISYGEMDSVGSLAPVTRIVTRATSSDRRASAVQKPSRSASRTNLPLRSVRPVAAGRFGLPGANKIGRASCRERVWIALGTVTIQK